MRKVFYILTIILFASLAIAQDSTFTIQYVASPITYWNVNKSSSQWNANISYLTFGESKYSGLSWVKPVGIGGNINYKRALFENYGANTNVTYAKIKIPFAQREEKAELVELGGNGYVNIIDNRKKGGKAENMNKLGLTLSLGTYYSLFHFTILDFVYASDLINPLSCNCEISEIGFPACLVAHVPLSSIFSCEPLIRYTYKKAGTTINIPEYIYNIYINEYYWTTQYYNYENKYGIFDYGINVNIRALQKTYLYFGAILSKTNKLQENNITIVAGVKKD